MTAAARTPAPRAGWFPDPWAAGRLRRFEGATWTVDVAPGAAPVFTPRSVVLLGCCSLLVALTVLLALPYSLVAAVASLPVLVLVALVVKVFQPGVPDPRRARWWALGFGAGPAGLAALVLNTSGAVVVATLAGASPADLFGGPDGRRPTWAVLVVVAVVAPVVEESAKALALVHLARRGHLPGPLAGLVLATLVAGAFAFVEDVDYLADAASRGVGPFASTFVARVVVSPFVHPVFTSCTGVALGLAVRSRRRWLVPVGLAAAVVAHGAWNVSAAVFPPALFVFAGAALGLWLAAAFALRRRAAAPGGELSPPPAAARAGGPVPVPPPFDPARLPGAPAAAPPPGPVPAQGTPTVLVAAASPPVGDRPPLGGAFQPARRPEVGAGPPVPHAPGPPDGPGPGAEASLSS